MELKSRLKMPPTPKFRRPPELAYASEELPPPTALAGLVIQHTVTALALIVYALVIAQIGGLDKQASQAVVTAAILGMAIVTFLHAWGGKTGSGLLLVGIPSPITVLTAGLIVTHTGISGLATATVIHGLIAMCAGYLVPRMRTVLTPIVAGVIICVAGLALIESGLRQVTGLNEEGMIDGSSLLVSGATLAIITALSVWGSRRAKLYALLAGLVTGLILAGLQGQLHGADLLMEMPAFALPSVPGFSFELDFGMVLAMALLSLMAQLDTFGCVVLLHKMNDAGWRRPDMRLISGGMRANGLGDLAAAVFGAPPLALSSANIALCHISRSTARIIGLICAALLATCALLPKATLALTLIPTPILGAIGLYAAAYLIVSGIELIASRAMDARAIFMIGLAFIAGIGVMILPQLALAAPASLQFAASNAIVMSGVVAVCLNLLFRIGISQSASSRLTGGAPVSVAQQITDFVEHQGKLWNARREVIARAATACLEAAESVQAAGQGNKLQAIEGRFDEYNLDLTLRHDGPPLSLEAGGQVLPENILDMDDHEYTNMLDQALTQVSQALLRNLADRITSGEDSQGSWLRLHFDH